MNNYNTVFCILVVKDNCNLFSYYYCLLFTWFAPWLCVPTCIHSTETRAGQDWSGLIRWSQHPSSQGNVDPNRGPQTCQTGSQTGHAGSHNDNQGSRIRNRSFKVVRQEPGYKHYVYDN